MVIAALVAALCDLNRPKHVAPDPDMRAISQSGAALSALNTSVITGSALVAAGIKSLCVFFSNVSILSACAKYALFRSTEP